MKTHSGDAGNTSAATVLSLVSEAPVPVPVIDIPSAGSGDASGDAAVVLKKLSVRLMSPTDVGNGPALRSRRVAIEAGNEPDDDCLTKLGVTTAPSDPDDDFLINSKLRAVELVIVLNRESRGSVTVVIVEPPSSEGNRGRGKGWPTAAAAAAAADTFAATAAAAMPPTLLAARLGCKPGAEFSPVCTWK